MRAGKKESIGVLIGAMAEAESKSFYDDTEAVTSDLKYSLQGTTQGRYLTGGVPPVRFSM